MMNPSHKIQVRKHQKERSLVTKQYTGTMKIPDCDRCLLYAHRYTVHQKR
ncbi:hypothetical protein LC605_01445 [Nostoc sp. CHAB 5836]|nr:hypothetical protein [Nostoc sp. CHAB 5836]MCC5613763.1 hypothetical protein [Nostoc sp. CHAB 5836]